MSKKNPLNEDPISHEIGAHPVGTAIGAGSGALAGAAIGAVVAGPVGAIAGAISGVVAGGLTGKEVGEALNPTVGGTGDNNDVGIGTGATAGAIAGATLGAPGGPLGAIAGATLGAVAGGYVGDKVEEKIEENMDKHHAHEAKSDTSSMHSYPPTTYSNASSPVNGIHHGSVGTGLHDTLSATPSTPLDPLPLNSRNDTASNQVVSPYNSNSPSHVSPVSSPIQSSNASLRDYSETGINKTTDRPFDEIDNKLYPGETKQRPEYQSPIKQADTAYSNSTVK